MPIELAIVLPMLLWLLFRFTMSPGPYNMDPCGKGTFFLHLIMYSVFGYAVVALSVFGACWGTAMGLDWHPALVLLFAAVCGLLFVGLLSFWYEGYMVQRYPGPELVGPSNYTIGKYAAVLALGFSSVALLIVGALWTAAEAGR